jgi:RNA polymerase sigma-70 factor (ECF subfamily)
VELGQRMSDLSALRFSPFPLEEEDASAQSTSVQNQVVAAADETLILRLGRGDREACSCLFRRYAAAVRNIGRRILCDNAEADDVVQEVFLYLFRKSTVFDKSKGSARSWIFQIAYTQALLRRRELKARGSYLSGIPDKHIECDQSGDRKGAHYDHTVQGLFGRNRWKAIVEELTEDQRATLRLHFFEGLTFAEIAEKLGQSHRNIRNHYYRGLEKLRQHLAKNELNAR